MRMNCLKDMTVRYIMERSPANMTGTERIMRRNITATI